MREKHSAIKKILYSKAPFRATHFYVKFATTKMNAEE